MKYWIFLLSVAFSCMLKAETTWQANLQLPFAVTVTLSHHQIALDENLKLDLTFHYPSSYTLATQDVLDQLRWSANPLAPSFHLSSFLLTSLPMQENIQAQRLCIRLSPLTTGTLSIPPLALSLMPDEKNASPVRVLIPPFFCEVSPASSHASSLPLAPLMPLEPQFPLGLTEANRLLLLDHPQRLEEEKKQIQANLEKHAFPWLTLLFLAGGGGLGWMIYLMRDHWVQYGAKPLLNLSPLQQAEQAFAALYKQGLLEQGLFQRHYAALSSILLDALSKHLDWPAKAMTTQELCQKLKEEKAFSSQQKQELMHWLTEIDQVKFAGKNPTLQEASHLTQSISRFILHLFPAPASISAI